MSPEDMLAELNVLQNRRENKTEIVKDAQSVRCGTFPGTEAEQESGLIQYLDFHPKSVDEVLEFVQKEDEEMTVSQLMFELIQLCMQGKAVQVGGNYFMKMR